MRVVSRSRSSDNILFVVIDLDLNKAFLKMRKKDDYKRYKSRRENNLHRQFWIRLKVIQSGSDDEVYFKRLICNLREENKLNKPNYKLEIIRGSSTTIEYFSSLKRMAEYLGVSPKVVRGYRNLGMVNFYDGTLITITQNLDVGETPFYNPKYVLR